MSQNCKQLQQLYAGLCGQERTEGGFFRKVS